MYRLININSHDTDQLNKNDNCVHIECPVDGTGLFILNPKTHSIS